MPENGRRSSKRSKDVGELVKGRAEENGGIKMKPGYFGEHVWTPPGEDRGVMGESKGPEYEEKFVKILCDDLCKILGVSWHDQRIVTEVLKFTLNDKIRDLLDQYLNSQLEMIARGFKHDFKLPEAKIDHEYVVHARFDSLKEELRKSIKEYVNDKLRRAETKLEE